MGLERILPKHYFFSSRLFDVVIERKSDSANIFTFGRLIVQMDTKFEVVLITKICWCIMQKNTFKISKCIFH